MHERKQIHTHIEPKRTQAKKSTLYLSVTTHFTITHTNTITTAVVIQGLDASVEGMLLKPSKAVRKTLMPKGSNADREQTVWSHVNTVTTYKHRHTLTEKYEK